MYLLGIVRSMYESVYVWVRFQALQFPLDSNPSFSQVHMCSLARSLAVCMLFTLIIQGAQVQEKTSGINPNFKTSRKLENARRKKKPYFTQPCAKLLSRPPNPPHSCPSLYTIPTTDLQDFLLRYTRLGVHTSDGLSPHHQSRITYRSRST
jgi:hypothetical protein